MRKIISSLFALTLLPTFMSGAHAVCFADRNNDPDLMYDYTVYFEFAKPEPSRTTCSAGTPVNANGCCGSDAYDDAAKKCKSSSGTSYDSAFKNMAADLADGTESCARDLYTTLNSIPVDGDTRIFLIATADKMKTGTYDNGALSGRRYDMIMQLFDAKHRGYVAADGIRAGDINDSFTGTTGRNQDERTVRIIVAYGPAAPAKIDEIKKQYTVAYGIGSTISVNIDKSFSSGQRIRNTVRSLDELTHDLNTSVWKTADGNFNGARLASDSIAGVVLGTAGGLITSNIVKKNQIKHGFEDIKCTIGGQSVAEFGDEFSVGIK